ncbi:MAG: TetR/AcrR family transcriptional regulator [Pseudomonadota bacterium]
MAITTRLLEAAEKRMRRGGYNAVSFRDLASDTGIKSSSVHYHFPKKEDLGVALVERYSERFFDALEEAASSARTPKDRLDALVRVYRSALVEDEAICLCGLLGAEVAGLPYPLSQGIQTFFTANIEWVEDALPDTIKKAERNKIAGMVIAGLQGAMMIATSLADTDIFDDISATMVKQALPGD